MVGVISRLFGSSDGMKIRAIILYPNHGLDIKNISADNKRFKIGKNTYLVDEKAIYFKNRFPVSIYYYGVSSPLVYDEKSDSLTTSMRSDELQSVIDSKIAQDLITATSGNDWTMYAAFAAAGLALLSVLIQTGLIKVGGN